MLIVEGTPKNVSSPKEAWEIVRMRVRQKQRWGESKEEIRRYVQKERKRIKDEFSEKTNQNEVRP